MHKYEMLTKELMALIEEQLARNQERLPTEAALCSRYFVSRQTLRRSMDELVRRGLIERRQGSGNYITGLLPSGRKKRAAIVVCRDLDYSYPEVPDKLHAAIPEGFDTEIYITDYSVRREREILIGFLDFPPRLLFLEAIASALPTPNEDLLTQLIARGTEILFIGDAYPGFASYASESRSLPNPVPQIVEKLIALGHSRISCILPMDQSSGLTVYRDFLRTCFEALSEEDYLRYEPEESVCWYRNKNLLLLKEKQDLRFLTDFINGMPSSCSAVICYNDEIAYWLVRLLRMRNRSMRELTVISLKNTKLSDSSLRSEFRPEFSWRTADRFLKDKAEIM